MTKFILFMNLDMVDRNSEIQSSPAFDKVNELE